jgi:spermidine synthase
MAGLVLFPGDEAFWRRLHGLTVEKAIVAEDKTGLSLLKLSDTQSGKLYIQGHSQSRLPFDTVHSFLGAIGPLVHPAPKRVLVIGSGTGGTPYAAGLHPGTERVRVIEIVAPVIATLRDYIDRGGKSGVEALLTNPKFEVVVADGRHALALDPARYDVIEADAILPKTALSGLLNSQEFFRQVRAKLAPGGIYVQWAPTERSIETFRSIFPYVTMVHPALLGSDRPIPYARDKILELLGRPEIDLHLAVARIDRGDLLKWFEEKKIEVLNDGKVVPAASPNTDFFPRDEYYLNRP